MRITTQRQISEKRGGREGGKGVRKREGWSEVFQASARGG